jgi:ElaB/YqjD/DUF883 family membrane-anchored ribosome-binding protein
MADETDGSSGTTSRTADLIGERETSVFAEFVDAARSAAESMLEEQRQQVAEKVSGIAEALRNAAKSLDQSQNRALAGYVDQAADQAESVFRTVRERRWNEIVADTEDFARRQPTWFVLGAVATGFLVGRFLWASTGAQRGRRNGTRDPSDSKTPRAVTAAVSSGSGTGAGEVADYAAGSSGVMEDR